MTRANKSQTRVFYKGDSDDFLIYVDSVEDYRKWKADKSIPLAHVTNGAIYVTHGQGTQGIQDKPSDSMLISEFGTKNRDECAIKILNSGTLMETENHERSGDRNITQGSFVAHS